MSRTVHVDLGERAYVIHIGREVPLGVSLDPHKHGRILVVTDSNVDPVCGAKCEKVLKGRGFEVSRAVVPAGEASKDLRVASDLYAQAVQFGLDRSSVILALGGGMIGDLSGFVAATFLRGIRLVQVPTTLLAMVDSSIGGKTGLNLPQGKNLVGVFHQPVEVDADLDTLRTLPEKEYVSGLAEVVKYGIIWDAMLFSEIEEKAHDLLARDANVLESVVARCCEIKAEVVAMDERETGVRAILNFGHTLAHALEKAADFKCLHGNAVAAGMVYAAELAVQEKGFARSDFDRLVGLLTRLGLPVYPGDVAPGSDWKTIRKAMQSDKKTHRQIPRFVLPEKLGSVLFGCDVPEARVEKAWDSLKR